MLLSPCEFAVEVSRKMTDDMRSPIDGKSVKIVKTKNWVIIWDEIGVQRINGGVVIH